MKVKLLAPVLMSAEVLILYLLRDNVHGIVKCLPLIKWLRLIFSKLIPYPRAESFSRAPFFPTPRPKALP